MNKIVYKNFAPGAAENADVSDESSDFQSITDFASGAEPLDFATFESTGIDLLNPSLSFAEAEDDICFVSSGMSSAGKLFPNGGTKLVIELNGGYYSGPGLTLHFHQNLCREIKLEFYKDAQLLYENSYFPVLEDCFCNADVEMYNKVVITFLTSEEPYQFVKLKSLDFGNTQDITEFFGSINIFEEIAPDCSDLPYDTCEFEAFVPEGITPQSGQSFYVYHNSQCFGKFTAENIEEDTDRRFIFEASDDKATLKSNAFPALANGEITVAGLNKIIRQNSDVTINSGEYGNVILKGFIKSDNCRYAVAMMSMAGGFFISSARNTELCMLKPRYRESVLIGADRILGKARYRKTAPYTKISLYEHIGAELDKETALRYMASPEYVLANVKANELEFDKYSLVTNSSERLNDILSVCGFERNEIEAEIILEDEKVGDILSIETPQGIKTGIIKSLDICINGMEITAKAVLIETEVTQ